MNIWRLIAHDEKADDAITIMIEKNRIALGWSDTGDLTARDLGHQRDISRLIQETHPTLLNAHLGGPSLWNLLRIMEVGDFVIINNNQHQRKCVFEVIGPYIYDQDHPILGYSHHRPAVLTDIRAEELWTQVGSAVANGQNIRWALALCEVSESARETIHKEGERYSVLCTRIERNPHARDQCIRHYGYKCQICNFDFGEVYGELGHEFIHVHHIIDMAKRGSEYTIDPIIDLIPLCPNCHAMVHRSPSYSIDSIKDIIHRQKIDPINLDG